MPATEGDRDIYKDQLENIRSKSRPLQTPWGYECKNENDQA